ncbi:hypothetical protein RB628_05570 [Streptomyces sp. ADMS]|uniref:hypothetical protein n=1 Tax=Streptomyces sp. ADMS TaxID=3071415 RepID=UPI00296F41F0|nr:hypothetical protein [Streptomyces sp. ADMS]MDW4904827.1 hypothetical protein [Streptomyces sp. ADMS]
MSGGPRYWNEETQRWEDAESRNAAPTTPPPPPRPNFLPTGPGAAGADAPASGPPTADPVAAETLPLVSGPAEAPEGSASVGWPGAAAQSVWPATAVGEAATDGGGPFAGEPNASWPPAGQPAKPVGTGGPRRRLMWSVLIGAAVVAVAVSLVLTFVVRPGDDDKDDRSTAAHETTTSTTSPTPVTSEPTEVTESPTVGTASPSAAVSEPPVGYALYEDREGFRIAFPEGWTRTTADSSYGISVVNYRSPDRTHRIQVYQVSEPSPAESFDLFLSDETPKAPGFTEIRRETLDDGTFTGSRLEYLADSIRGEPEVGTWHVYDERFVASDSNIYAIAAYGPDSDGRDDELELLTTALDWFCPPLGACAAAIPQDSTLQTP